MPRNPSLSLVQPPATSPQLVATPPRPLGLHGTKLWESIHREYAIHDAGGVEMLASACASLDRAEQLRECIDAEGPLIRIKGGLRDNPLLKHELAARAFVVRTIQKLGLNFEPLLTPGRPPGR
jgi:hypothetical protein